MSACGSISISVSISGGGELVDPLVERSAGAPILGCASEELQAGGVIRNEMYGMLVKTVGMPDAYEM